MFAGPRIAELSVTNGKTAESAGTPDMQKYRFLLLLCSLSNMFDNLTFLGGCPVGTGGMRQFAAGMRLIAAGFRRESGGDLPPPLFFVPKKSRRGRWKRIVFILGFGLDNLWSR